MLNEYIKIFYPCIQISNPNVNVYNIDTLTNIIKYSIFHAILSLVAYFSKTFQGFLSGSGNALASLSSDPLGMSILASRAL